MEELTGVVIWENPLDTICKSVLRLLHENAFPSSRFFLSLSRVSRLIGDLDKDEVNTRYLTSAFLERGRMIYSSLESSLTISQTKINA